MEQPFNPLPFYVLLRIEPIVIALPPLRSLVPPLGSNTTKLSGFDSSDLFQFQI